MVALAVPRPEEPNSPARPSAHTPFHIPSLDGLRALSFLIVFGAHAGLDWVIPGGFGVTVFFFLSGYLITTLMRIEAEKTSHVSLKKFYLRRALRILPPFYIVLLAATTLGVVGFLRSAVPPQPLPVASQILHFSNYWVARHGWDGIATGTSVYWSLAVEEHYYLVAPTVFLGLNRSRLTGWQRACIFWAACAVVLAWRYVLVLRFHSNPERTYLCTDTRFDSIAFGCALAVWHNPVLDAAPTARAESHKWLWTLLSTGLALLLITFVLRGPVFRQTLRYSLQGMALTPIFIAAVRWPRARPFAPLNWKAVRFIGTLSYSLYLVHEVAFSAVEQHLQLSAPANAAVALVVSLAIAWVMYEIVEKPCAALRKRLSEAG